MWWVGKALTSFQLKNDANHRVASMIGCDKSCIFAEFPAAISAAVETGNEYGSPSHQFTWPAKTT
jgi:hypothetical protein